MPPRVDELDAAPELTAGGGLASGSMLAFDGGVGGGGGRDGEDPDGESGHVLLELLVRLLLELLFRVVLLLGGETSEFPVGGGGGGSVIMSPP